MGGMSMESAKEIDVGEISIDSAEIKRKSVIGIANQQKQLEIKKKRAAAFCLGESEVVWRFVPRPRSKLKI